MIPQTLPSCPMVCSVKLPYRHNTPFITFAGIVQVFWSNVTIRQRQDVSIFFLHIGGAGKISACKIREKSRISSPGSLWHFIFLPLEYLFAVYIAKLVMVGDRDRNCIHPSYRIHRRQCMIQPAIHISHFHFNLRTIAINEDDVSAKFLSTVNRRQVI